MQHRRAAVITPLIAALLALSLGTPLRGDVNNSARVALNPNASGGGGPVDNLVSHPGTCDATGSTTGGFNSSGNGTAHTVYGFIRLNCTDSGSIYASCSGIFRDSITITSPGVPAGTTGTVTYSVTVAGGSLSAPTGDSGAGWQLFADIGGGATDIGRSGQRVSPHLGGGYTGDAFGTFTATTNFQFGFPSALIVQLNGNAQASYSTPENPGSASFSNLTVTWAGISSVTIGGSPIPTWTVTSESGTDWGGAINPCPADLGSQGGNPGPDGLLDNNDFIVFIDYFFNNHPLADFGMQGGVPGQDGLFDNNDFVVFIQQFFDGC